MIDCIFVQFDIEEFYPSISKDLVLEAINYAKQFIDISQKNVDMILHARKSLLFADGTVWTKQADDNLFDVTMGSYDGAEICELVGLYVLNLLGDKFGRNNLGLYRDDGLAYFKNVSGPKSDRIRKDIIKIFKDIGLKITIETNLKRVNFLDVTFDLQTETFKPYHKPNDLPSYINTKSNHPPNIIKAIPESISRRISNISSDENIFHHAAPYYNNALASAGYQTNIDYSPNIISQDKSRKRSRNVIWYNPPYSINVKTNIARHFLNLIDRHFPKGHKFRKLFNRNNVKVSYSCMPNFAAIVTSHNKRILSK